MPNGYITKKLRPIKLALLVDPTDRSALLEAIEINTFLWGGMYNPIIPTFRSRPKPWRGSRLDRMTSKQIFAGYLDAFDPDYVVPVGKCTDYKLEVGNREIISSSEILAGIEDDQTPKYGIGFFEVARHLYTDEFKYVRRNPLKIVIPKFTSRHNLLLAAVFGKFPDNIQEVFDSNFKGALEARDETVTIYNYSQFLDPEILFLRRITSLYLNSYRVRSWGDGQCVFLLDANSPTDIIDYWNLRAAGWSVIPVPIQASDTDQTQSFVEQFIENNYYPHRFNPQLFHSTTLLRGRLVSDQVQTDYRQSLRLTPITHPNESKIVHQNWYPRIWDEWARNKDGIECCELESEKGEDAFNDQSGRFSFKTLDPKFANRFGGHGEARFANEIEFEFLDQTEMYSEVIPEGGKSLHLAIGAFDFSEWRFSRRGLVYLSNHLDWTVHLSVPKSEDVFSSWMSDNHWKIKLSAPGKLAVQMIKHLGGKWGISTLANKGLIDLLMQMGKDKTISKEEFHSAITTLATEEKYPKDPKIISQRLTDVKAVQLGLELQCPICQLRTWYSLTSIDYEVVCQNCLENFLIPSHSPDTMKWSYRSLGPFSLPNRAYGVYSVLLTLRFFSQLLRGSTTPILSFNATKGRIEIEADLGIFYQESGFGRSNTDIIFAECKTYGSFTKKDVDRMNLLADQFPGAILVFATLKNSITETEKKLLRPLVNRGRRYWNNERPYNPILILTGIELFADHGPRNTWNDVGGKHAEFAKRYIGLDDMLQICDATQQIYLEMNPWHEWLQEKWEKKRIQSG